MIDVCIVVLWYIISFGIHAVLHRIFIRNLTILLGLCSLYFLSIPWIILYHMYVPPIGLQLPITASFMTIISGMIMITLYYPRFLEYQTPSSILFAAFRKKELWTQKELHALFSEKELIDVRLHALLVSKVIRINEGVIRLTFKGRILFYIFSFFSWVTGMEAGG